PRRWRHSRSRPPQRTRREGTTAARALRTPRLARHRSRPSPSPCGRPAAHRQPPADREPAISAAPVQPADAEAGETLQRRPRVPAAGQDPADPPGLRSLQSGGGARPRFALGRTLATPAEIAGFTPQRFRRVEERIFCPENLLIGVTGDFDERTLLAKLESLFRGWERCKPGLRELPPLHFAQGPPVVLVEKD